MDEKRLLNRLHFLSHSLFIANENGVEFLKLMKMQHVLTPTFPQPEHVIEQHGGAVGWSAFREGQLTLIRAIEAMAQNYRDKIEAENKGDKNG